MIGPRKKIYSQRIYFSILHSSRLFRHQNNWIMLSPRPPPVEYPCLALLRNARVFLVGCCIWNINRQPFKATAFFFSLLSLLPQTMVWHSSRTFIPDCAPCPMSHLPQMPTFGWLLCCQTKKRPPKAEVTSLSLIFYVLCFWCPKQKNKQQRERTWHRTPSKGP